MVVFYWWLTRNLNPYWLLWWWPGRWTIDILWFTCLELHKSQPFHPSHVIKCHKHQQKTRKLQEIRLFHLYMSFSWAVFFPGASMPRNWWNSALFICQLATLHHWKLRMLSTLPWWWWPRRECAENEKCPARCMAKQEHTHTHMCFPNIYRYRYRFYVFLCNDLCRVSICSYMFVIPFGRTLNLACLKINRINDFRQDKDRGYNSARRSSLLWQKGLGGSNHSSRIWHWRSEKKTQKTKQNHHQQMLNNTFEFQSDFAVDSFWSMLSIWIHIPSSLLIDRFIF